VILRAPERIRALVRGLALAALCWSFASGARADDLARGDAAWARRAHGERDGLPQPGPIGEALRAYESALAARPDDLEARWKLLRAIHFAGDFTAPPPARKREIFERGRAVAAEGLSVVARKVGAGPPLEDMAPELVAGRLAAVGVPSSDVARFYFWAAVNWGGWSRTVGLVNAVRQGGVSRLHEYTEISIALEPDYEDGGAYRLLGRLHAELPRVPLVTGWVDRDLSIPLVERAYALAPATPGNQLLLALTLLDLAPERSGEARALLREVVSLTPRPSFRIEDLAVRELARERLGEPT
jgi:hypothetical protein